MMARPPLLGNGGNIGMGVELSHPCRNRTPRSLARRPFTSGRLQRSPQNSVSSCCCCLLFFCTQFPPRYSRRSKCCIPLRSSRSRIGAACSREVDAAAEFVLVWPEGYLLLAFVGAAVLSDILCLLAAACVRSVAGSDQNRDRLFPDREYGRHGKASSRIFTGNGCWWTLSRVGDPE